MKTKFLLLLSWLFLTCVQPVCADTVIPLSLVEDSNDGPAQDGKDPVTPNQFVAMLENRTLFVQTEVNETMYLQIQNEQTEEIVLDTRFNNSISYQMINYGSYWLYLTCKNTKLVGHFQIEMSQNEAADIVLKMFETKEDVEIFVSNDMYTVGDTVRLMKMLGVEDIVVDAKSWVAYVDLYPNANLSHDFQYFLIDACSGKTSDYMRGWPPDKSIELFASFRSIDWRQGLKVPTPQSAFEIVDNMFKDDTVSIYISKDLHYGGTAIDLYFGDKLKIPTPIVPYWVAFVDLYPMANWSHPCEYVLIDAYSRNIIRIIKNWFPADEDEFSLFRWDTKSEKTGLLNTKFEITCTPNPVTSTLFVSSYEEIISIDIYDIDGQNVISTGETTIDVSRLSKGIYMVIAESASGKGQIKFVKQ